MIAKSRRKDVVDGAHGKRDNGGAMVYQPIIGFFFFFALFNSSEFDACEKWRER